MPSRRREIPDRRRCAARSAALSPAPICAALQLGAIGFQHGRRMPERPAPVRRDETDQDGVGSPWPFRPAAGGPWHLPRCPPPLRSGRSRRAVALGCAALDGHVNSHGFFRPGLTTRVALYLTGFGTMPGPTPVPGTRRRHARRSCIGRGECWFGPDAGRPPRRREHDGNAGRISRLRCFGVTCVTTTPAGIRQNADAVQRRRPKEHRRRRSGASQ